MSNHGNEVWFVGTRAEASAIIRKALDEGRLSRQGTPSCASYYESGVHYADYNRNRQSDGVVRQCAIGQLIGEGPGEYLQHKLDGENYPLASALHDAGNIVITDMDRDAAREWLSSIQRRHDSGLLGSLADLLV